MDGHAVVDDGSVVHKSSPGGASGDPACDARQVTVLFDTDALRSRANAIDRAADDVRSRSRQLVAAADGARWLSLAASRYRTRTAAVSSRLGAVAASLEHAARLLRAHADTVDHRVHQLLVAIPSAAVSEGEHVLSTVAHHALSSVTRWIP